MSASYELKYSFRSKRGKHLRHMAWFDSIRAVKPNKKITCFMQGVQINSANPVQVYV